MTQGEALTILKTGANVFLTGEPGAGKTHTINAYVEYLRQHEIEPAITASTGIAATHIGGMTIHSWSGIGIRSRLTPYDLDKIAGNEYVSKRIRKTKVLIIDEISMLQSSMLDMVEAVCREVKQSNEAFGGIQVVLVGDFFQLPPIIKMEATATPTYDEDNQDQGLFTDTPPLTNFAYESNAWKRAKPLVCYISEQYRQDDSDFLSVLSAIRRGEVFEEHMEYINGRQVAVANAPDGITRLFSHNVAVDKVNDTELAKIQSDEKTFVMYSSGREQVVASLKKGCLSPEVLKLKIGAVVMCTKNNQKAGFVNGTLGVVEKFEAGTNYPIIRTRDNTLITIEPLEWAVEEDGKIKGQISQVPLRLAWAITVHKSQGMSLDAAVMDLSSVFEYGQGYVALSRVRRLSGLYLLGINTKALQVHPAILEKDKEFREISEQTAGIFEEMPKDEVEKMQENFVIASGGNFLFKLSGKKQKAEKLDTKGITLALWNEGKNIAEIAKERNITAQTVFDHIEKLVQEKKIGKEDVQRLLTPEMQESLLKIHNAFLELDTDKLTPVFEKLKGKYTYDDLRIARLLR
jgi:ATP-dependent DNA helicase PIF1